MVVADVREEIGVVAEYVGVSRINFDSILVCFFGSVVIVKNVR